MLSKLMTSSSSSWIIAQVEILQEYYNEKEDLQKTEQESTLLESSWPFNIYTKETSSLEISNQTM
jgi:hypothetical protein